MTSKPARAMDVPLGRDESTCTYLPRKCSRCRSEISSSCVKAGRFEIGTTMATRLTPTPVSSRARTSSASHAPRRSDARTTRPGARPGRSRGTAIDCATRSASALSRPECVPRQRGDTSAHRFGLLGKRLRPGPAKAARTTEHQPPQVPDRRPAARDQMQELQIGMGPGCQPEIDRLPDDLAVAGARKAATAPVGGAELTGLHRAPIALGHFSRITCPIPIG